MSKLNIGDSLPKFSLPNQDNEIVDLQQFVGKPLVLFFYPKDDTFGCTKEACSFRDSYADFLDLGAQVVGVSSDSADSHQNFIQKHRLPYPLLSDTKQELRAIFGVPRSWLGLLPGRVTYIFDAEGKLRHIFDSQIQVFQHTKEALEELKKMVK